MKNYIFFVRNKVTRELGEEHDYQTDVDTKHKQELNLKTLNDQFYEKVAYDNIELAIYLCEGVVTAPYFLNKFTSKEVTVSCNFRENSQLKFLFVVT